MGIKVAGIASVDINKPNEKRNSSRKKKEKPKDMKKNKHKTDDLANAREQAQHYPARTLALRLAHPK
jgi:hypothetical protein